MEGGRGTRLAINSNKMFVKLSHCVTHSFRPGGGGGGVLGNIIVDSGGSAEPMMGNWK